MNESDNCLIAYVIETSSACGSVALVADDRVLIERSFTKGLRHGTDLVPALDDIVTRAGLDRLRMALVVVGTGPGSYTGVRVGIASAKALAFALAVPLVGVPSADAAVYALAPEAGRRAAVVVDAKREQVYLSTYEADGGDWKLRGAHRILPPERAARSITPGTQLTGDGAERYRTIFTSAGLEIVEDTSAVPHAGRLGMLGLTKFRASDADELLTVEPLYLRLSEAEERKDRNADAQSAQSTT